LEFPILVSNLQSATRLHANHNQFGLLFLPSLAGKSKHVPLGGQQSGQSTAIVFTRIGQQLFLDENQLFTLQTLHAAAESLSVSGQISKNTSRCDLDDCGTAINLSTISVLFFVFQVRESLYLSHKNRRFRVQYSAAVEWNV